MKIMFISAASNIHTVRWVNTLSHIGHEVHLVYLPNHEEKDNKITNDVIKHKLKYQGNKGYFLNKLCIRKIYETIKPDIVNTHYASGYGTLSRISKLKPLVLSVWGSDVYDFPYKNKFNFNIVKKNLLYAQHIASTSNCMADQVRKLLDNETLDITITPFGVDIDLFRPIERTKNNKEFVFGIVKTLSKKYGIDYLIKSFSVLVERVNLNNLDIKPILEIYGMGPDEENLKKLCVELKIEDNVFFYGYVENIKLPNIINRFDIFCLSSILDSESFGVSAVEAMSCGIPIIATDVDGFKEVIEDNVTGYIVPRCDEVIMADRMYELMLDNNKRILMSKEGRKRVERLYNWHDNVKIMEKLYKNIM